VEASGGLPDDCAAGRLEDGTGLPLDDREGYADEESPCQNEGMGVLCMGTKRQKKLLPTGWRQAQHLRHRSQDSFSRDVDAAFAQDYNDWIKKLKHQNGRLEARRIRGQSRTPRRRGGQCCWQ
jgi:hypothetical protein